MRCLALRTSTGSCRFQAILSHATSPPSQLLPCPRSLRSVPGGICKGPVLGHASWFLSSGRWCTDPLHWLVTLPGCGNLDLDVGISKALKRLARKRIGNKIALYGGG